VTILYFVEGCVTFLEVSKGAFRNIGNLCDIIEGMSSTLDQSKGSASTFRYLLNSAHGVFWRLSKN